MKEKTKRKFHIPARTNFWVGVAFGGIFIFYLVITALLNYKEMFPPADNSSGYARLLYVLNVLRDILLTVLSILGTTWLTSWIIEMRTKNELYDNFLSNDFFSDPRIYSNMTPSVQKEMLSNLENALILHNNQHLSEMYGNIKDKFSSLGNENYYYEDCSYTVNCSIKSDRIEKSISRTIKVKSYHSSEEVNGLQLLSWSGCPLPHHLTDLVLHHITLDGQPISNDNLEKRKLSPNHITGVDSGYTKKYSYHYKKPIELSDSKARIFSISYSTITPLDDIVYTCRANVPCKNFSVDFRVNEPTECKVTGRAFGFFDAAVHSPIIEEDQQVKVSFNDWIFPYDGVVITFYPKNANFPQKRRFSFCKK